MIKRRKLEILLEKLAKPDSPRSDLEQYVTSPDVASDMLWLALAQQDIQGKTVADLGCGNGILGIGAALLGASSVKCYDIDPKMVLLCEENAGSAGVKIEVQCSEISEIQEHFDTVIQNPPFGAQRKGADRPFIETAIRISKVAYSLHLAETTDFVADLCRSLNANAQYIKNYKLKIPFMFEFHTKPMEFVDVALLRIISRR